MGVRDRIQRIVDDRGITQTALAGKIGHRQQWVNSRLLGVTQIKADELPLFAKALGVSACSLLDEEPATQPAAIPQRILDAPRRLTGEERGMRMLRDYVQDAMGDDELRDSMRAILKLADVLRPMLGDEGEME